MTGTVVTKEYVRCPKCGVGESAVSHLKPRQPFGPWYCNACGLAYSGVRRDDGRIDLTLHPEKRKIATINVLVLPPQKLPVYFVVEGMRFEGEEWQRSYDDPTEQARFYYEEHSCPTNWLKPVMVYHDGDADPHGLLEFVRAVDDATLPPDETVGPNDRDRAIQDLIEGKS